MKLVKVSDIFDIKYGARLELNKLEICSNTDANCIPFVSTTEKNNGISAFVKIANDIIPNPAYTLSVACSGSILSTFYQKAPYYSGHHLYILIPKFTLLKKQALLYCTFIRANKYRYSYGRQANKTLKDILIPHPDELKRFTNIKIPKQPTKTPYQNKKVSLNDRKWGWFKLNDLFKISGTKTTKIKDLLERGYGKYPYITTQATDNGTEGFFNMYTENSNVLTIDSAVAGYCSYQANNFSASDHVEKLQPQFTMNQYIAIFLVTILNIDQYRFSYGRKASQTRMQTHKIRLPITNTGNPDWQFMEDYIKALPYSGNL